MEATSPNLLTLPRELRDRIYSYLTRQVDFNWERGDIFTLRGSDGHVQLVEPVPLRVLNCPMPELLRVHSRIYEEYNAVCINKLEAIIDPSLHTLEAPLFNPHPRSKTLSEAVLAQIRHVTSFLKLHARTTSQNLDWQNQLNLLQTVITKAPHLITLKVAFRQQYHTNTPIFNDTMVPSVLIPAAERLRDSFTHFLPEIPTTIHGMHMVQRGEGYHIGFAMLTRRQTYTAPHWTYHASGRWNYVFHGIRKMGVYMFARGENYAKRFWTEEEVIAQWPMRKYPAQVMENVGEEKRAAYARWPNELTEWVERRGVEDVRDWGVVEGC
jgi:hypothetical protein